VIYMSGITGKVELMVTCCITRLRQVFLPSGQSMKFKQFDTDYVLYYHCCCTSDIYVLTSYAVYVGKNFAKS
jgi:hypothetical protein